jgi:hypothetical protein
MRKCRGSEGKVLHCLALLRRRCDVELAFGDFELCSLFFLQKVEMMPPSNYFQSLISLYIKCARLTKFHMTFNLESKNVM